MLVTEVHQHIHCYRKKMMMLFRYSSFQQIIQVMPADLAFNIGKKEQNSRAKS